MQETPQGSTGIDSAEENLPHAEGSVPSRSNTPLWRDYLSYFTVRRLLTVGYAFLAVEIGAWAGAYLLPLDLGGLQRVISGPSRSEQLMKGDPFLGFHLRPGVEMVLRSEGRKVHVRTTDLGLGGAGFRDLGMEPPFDIVALGDSFTYCDDISVEGCWLRLLGERTGLSVADLGVAGYSTLAQARMLARYGSQLHPRIVLMTATSGDFGDNEQFDMWLRSGSDDFPKWHGEGRRHGLVRNTIARYSISYRLFLAARRARTRQMVGYKDDTLDLAFSFDPQWIDLTKHAAEKPGFRLMQDALLDMDAQANQMGAQLVVVFIPTKEEVYWDIARQYVQEELDVDHPRAVVRDFCEKKGLKFCDLGDVLRAEARTGKQLYLRVSGHWNDAGHAFVAGVVERYLREQKLLDSAVARRTDGAQPCDGSDLDQQD